MTITINFENGKLERKIPKWDVVGADLESGKVMLAGTLNIRTPPDVDLGKVVSYTVPWQEKAAKLNTPADPLKAGDFVQLDITMDADCWEAK